MKVEVHGVSHVIKINPHRMSLHLWNKLIKLLYTF